METHQIQILNFLQMEGWKLEQDNDESAYYWAALASKLGNIVFNFDFSNLNQGTFICVGYLPFECEMAQIETTALLLNQINRKLSHGFFSIDYEDGEMKYTYSINFHNTSPTIGLISLVVKPCVDNIRKYMYDIKEIARTVNTHSSPVD